MFYPDAASYAHGCGALFDVILHCPISIVFFFVAQFQDIVNTNHSNFEYTIDVFNIAFDISSKTVGMGSYLFGRQHAGESAHHSRRNCADDVV